MLRKRIVKHAIFHELGTPSCNSNYYCTCNRDSYCSCDEDKYCYYHLVSCYGFGCTCDSCATVCSAQELYCSGNLKCEKYYCVEIKEVQEQGCTAQCLPLY